MNRKLLTLLLISIYFSFLTPLSAGTEKTDAGKELFNKKCNKCHPLSKSLKKHKTRESWEHVVERMRIKRPTLFTNSEGTKITEYLFSIRGKKVAASKIKNTRQPQEVKVLELIPSKDYKEFPLDRHNTFKPVTVDQFIEPEVCSGCHEEIFKQWEGSMHSKSFLDPLWRASTKFFAAQTETSDEKLEIYACVKCHTPLGFRSGAITGPDNDFKDVPGILNHGIFCNWCHNISEVRSVGNADYDVTPGNGVDDPSTMLGRYKDSKSSFHPTKYSKLHTQSEFCGLCHNVSHAANLTPIESTYDEWKASPYNTGDPQTTVHCQDCHMRQTLTIPATGKTERPDSPGFACSNGPKRKHVPTHYIVGANTLKGENFGDETHIKLATARLKHAADIEIIESGLYRKSSIARIKVKVTNSGAGHYLPTGMTELRQMWLDIQVIDNTGRAIFSSGKVNDKGDIDHDAVIFNTVLGNKKGDPVINIALADRVLFDHRIPPKGYVIEDYAFFIPGYATEPLHVKAVLRYRSCSQSFANDMLKDEATIIPITDMAETVLNIRCK